MPSLIKQHQRLARSGGDPQEHTNFGVEASFVQVRGEKIPRGDLKDSNRGAPKTKGYHPEPDHGSAE